MYTVVDDFLHSNSHSNGAGLQLENDQKCRLILKYINDTLWKSCKEMYRLIASITGEKSTLNRHHKLLHLPIKRNITPIWVRVRVKGY